MACETERPSMVCDRGWNASRCFCEKCVWWRRSLSDHPLRDYSHQFIFLARYSLLHAPRYSLLRSPHSFTYVLFFSSRYPPLFFLSRYSPIPFLLLLLLLLLLLRRYSSTRKDKSFLVHGHLQLREVHHFSHYDFLYPQRKKLLRRLLFRRRFPCLYVFTRRLPRS